MILRGRLMTRITSACLSEYLPGLMLEPVDGCQILACGSHWSFCSFMQCDMVLSRVIQQRWMIYYICLKPIMIKNSTGRSRNTRLVTLIVTFLSPTGYADNHNDDKAVRE